MPELELIYFPTHGRALVARMLIKIAGIKCKDTAINFEEFFQMKPGKSPLISSPIIKKLQ